MKIVAFSDAHWHYPEVKLPDGDILVYAGDWCSGNDKQDTLGFAEYLRKQKHPYKIVVPGNHDRVAARRPSFVKKAFKNAGVIYLKDDYATVEGISFFGFPWVPKFGNWAFMCEEEGLKTRLFKFKKGTDVLITHGPPLGILDRVPEVGCVGSLMLATSILKKRPKIHIFGHIHGGHGHEESDHTHYYNVSVCNDEYELVYQPTIIEV